LQPEPNCDLPQACPEDTGLADAPDDVADAGEPCVAPAPRPPGPGLPESILWMIGVFVLQIISGVVAVVVVLVVSVANKPLESPAELISRIENLSPTEQMVFFGMPNLLCFLTLIGLGCLRLGRTPGRKLNLSPPSLTQFAIVISAVIPLGLVADALWPAAEHVWQEVVKLVPALDFMDEFSIEKLMEGIQGASLPLLLFFLAVVPAVGEEFVLRGLVGRGLVARWGLFWGVLLTSCLFAALHMYPAHVAAVFPIGVVMHLAYLYTRSFWMPVLFHFINNGIAAVYTSLAPTDNGLQEAGPLAGLGKWVAVPAAAYVVLCLVLLRKYRTEYLDADGAPAWPGYYTVEHPDPELSLRRVTPDSLPVAMLFGLMFLSNAAWTAYDVYNKSQAPALAVEAHEDQPARGFDR
jgi:hypothetical protein